MADYCPAVIGFRVVRATWMCVDLRRHHPSTVPEHLVKCVHPCGSDVKHVRFGSVKRLIRIRNLDVLMRSLSEPEDDTLANRPFLLSAIALVCC